MKILDRQHTSTSTLIQRGRHSESGYLPSCLFSLHTKVSNMLFHWYGKEISEGSCLSYISSIYIHIIIHGGHILVTIMKTFTCISNIICGSLLPK